MKNKQIIITDQEKRCWKINLTNDMLDVMDEIFICIEEQFYLKNE